MSRELIRVAEALGPLSADAVFVGGSILPLLITDPAAPVVRPTDDIDVIVEITTRAAYAELEVDLRSRGFRHDQRDGAPICRWQLGGLVVDVMPESAEILGFSNPWYPYARRTAEHYTFQADAGPAVVLRVATAVAFVATKFSAFRSPTRRHAGDLFASHDLEDILSVLDGRPEFDAELELAEADVRRYIGRQFLDLLASSSFPVAVEGHMAYASAYAARAERLIARLRQMAELATI